MCDNNDKKKYRRFVEARTFVSSLGLKNREEWVQWCKSNDRVSDIPTNPNRTYKNEWVNWGDFLGTGFIKSDKRKYRSFADAREFVRGLGFKENREWWAWSKTADMPSDIPANVRSVYEDEWEGWSDFLGTNVVANKNRQFRPFNDARTFAINLKLNGQKEWHEWCARSNLRPDDVPANPPKAYKDEWTGWGDFLGTNYIGNTKRAHKSFVDAREYVRSIGLKHNKDWRVWCKSKEKPNDIPTNPNRAYKEEWTSWGDFLGTEKVSMAKMVYRPFKEARAFIRSLQIKNQRGWSEWCKTEKPEDIPATPHMVYKEWKGLGDWLGVYNSWTKQAVIETLKSLLPIVHTLTPVEIFSIIQENGLANITNNSSNGNRFLVEDLMAIAKQPDNDFLIEVLSARLLDGDSGQNNVEVKKEDKIDFQNSTAIVDDRLPELKVKEILDSIDSVA